jgi:hypothetical protein
VPTLRALLCVIPVCLTLAACGSGAQTEPETTQPETSATKAPAAPEATETSGAPAPPGHGGYAQCLADHGVTQAPAPALGPAHGPAAPPPGVDPTTWEQAVQSCSGLAPGPAGS